jgi:tetratricopeptide (TPR) repeat protein
MKAIRHYQQFQGKYHAGCGEKPAENPGVSGIFAAIFCVIFLALPSPVKSAVATTDSAAASTGGADAKIASLIEQLRSDDSTARQSAAAAIVAMGNAARPAIITLAASQDPGVHEQAAQILLQLPWYLPGDPPEVKKLLVGYGSPEVDVRRTTIGALAILHDGIGLDALDRLVREEPSPAVQWMIVSCLRQLGNLDPFRAAQPDANNSRLLALCGYARVTFDPPGAIEYLRQCAELEFADPVDDGGEFDFVINLLCDSACDQKNYREAANLRRRELARGSAADDSGIPKALAGLFALQADYGPIQGLQEDMVRGGDDVQRPEIQYALAQMYGRIGDTARATAARQAAFAGSTTQMQRYEVGDYLCEHGWNDLAESELKTYLQLSAQNSPAAGFESRQADANVHLRLSNIAEERDDDLAAAQQKEQAMLLLPRDEQLTRRDSAGHEWPVPASEIWADIYWRYLRVAVVAHNQPEINRRLEQLLELKPTDADAAIEIVPLLRQMNRRGDADLMFKWSFDSLKKDLKEHPDDPVTLNGMAWLCAKCDRNLPEALVWAEKAARLSGGDAAILDTQAEVNFHLGRFAEAVRLETIASGLHPDDEFMKGQLARFRSAQQRGAGTTRP